MLVATLLTANAYDYMVNGICYNLNEDGNTVRVVPEIANRSPSYSSISGTVTIPRMVLIENRPYTVTSIDRYAFMGCSEITAVVIGDAITEVGSNAFNECTKLASVTFGRAVNTLSYGCFSECSALTTVEIPSQVTELNEEVFYECTALTTVTLPSGLTTLKDGVFAYCSKLETINGGENVVRSGRDALTDTKWYKNQPDGIVYFGKVAIGIRGNYPETVNIKEGTISVGDYFVRTDYIYNVNFPSTLKEIGNHGFEACRSLNNVTFPASLEVIGDMAFDAALAFTEVVIPDNVKTIGKNAFSRSKNITKLTIGKGVTSIGNTAFTSCSGLQNIYAYPNPSNVTTGKNIFSSVPTSSCVLHVMNEYLNAYQTTSPWSAFMPNVVGDLSENAAIPGDLNGDTYVQGDDLNMLINIVLGKAPATDAANVDGQGGVDGSDINMLINILLGKN